MLRVKNEARWIARVIESLLPICERVYVMDDHSIDGTATIAQQYEGVRCFRSPFEGLNESRDKDYLLNQIRKDGADIVVAIDGDEVLEFSGPAKIQRAVARGNAWSMKVEYLWDSDSQVRVDGVYSRMYRPSMFRLRACTRGFLKTPFGNGANLHCSSVPQELLHGAIRTDIRLLHLGYRDREDRLRKFAWYNSIDPTNKGEDGYRHIVQGDIPEVPADARLMHAGPLTLQHLSI
jgi:glycosyltransferase involved in cell wall biosynthesis